MATKVVPLTDHIVLKPVEQEEITSSGLVIPDSAKEKPQEAKVIALGTGKRDDEGKLIAFEVKVGDTVLISKYGGTEVKYAGHEYLILSARDVLAVVS